MRKITLTFSGLVLLVQFVFAGGLVTNTNQSTAWTRMLIRDATTEIDGVFYNPAGLVKLQDGFHISLSNQSIFQTQTITSDFPYLSPTPKEYVGNISAPFFPSLYLAYKTGRWAFSAGVNVVGGGGGAQFDSGVPLMEVPIAALVPTFSEQGVTGYSVDMSFSGQSAYWGIQAGVSFAINKNISLFAGARYVLAKNTYEGYMKDIRVQFADGSSSRADDFMNNVSAQARQGSEDAATGSQLAQSAGDQMQPLIDLNFGDLTFDQAVAGGILTPEQAGAIEAGLMQFGYSQEEIDAMTIQEGQQSFYTSSEYLSGLSTELLQQSLQLSAMALAMLDQEGDITQTGSGITPIIGVNLSFLDDDINIGIKYEFKTKMDLTNEIASYVDNNGQTVYKGFIVGIDEEGNYVYMFEDGDVTNADIPAYLSVGIDYRIIEPLKLSVGYHTYFDKQTQWAQDAEDAGQPEIDNNFFEIGFGLQYDINDSWLVSGGYLHANSGVNQNYQSDLSYSLTSNTIGLGGGWNINETFRLQLGGYYVMYNQQTYDYKETITEIPYKNTYQKSTWALSLGLDIALGSKKDK